MSKVITNENQLNTEVDDLVTENYALEVLGLKNPADFRKFSRSFMKLSKIVKGIDDSNVGKLDKGAVSSEYDTAKKIEDKIKTAQGTADNKLPKGSLPVTVPDGKTIYDLLENNGGINIDTALLYLNDAGTKTQGKVYFDKNKKGLFECIKTTTNTVNSTEFFVDISNKASSDRLTKLPKIIFEGKTNSFIIPEKYRNAKLFLVSFHVHEPFVFDDNITVLLSPKEERPIGVYKLHTNGNSFYAYIKIQDYIISPYKDSNTVATLKLEKIVALF